MNRKIVNNLRCVSATMIAGAGSGHTGISLGATPIFYSLYNDCMKYYPNVPDHPNRDRFVMDSGHASALLYATLHGFGFDYTKHDLMEYRKINSKTPGHPRVNPKLGVDASGGPLGQGIPMAVGMAIAERKLASRFNKNGINLVDHYTYCFAGDGGMMEGMTNEASSLAGTLGLNKLIVLYDSNNITIEGKTDLAFTENVLLRYRALGWNTIEVDNGEDTNAITSAIMLAKQSKDKPTIIKINTSIGYGTPYEGQNKIHGMALKQSELDLTIQKLGVNSSPYEFESDVKKALERTVHARIKNYENEKRIEELYKSKYPSEYAEYKKWLEDGYSLLVDWRQIEKQVKAEETRTSSFTILQNLAKQIPNLLVGSADLAPSTKVEIVGGGDFSKNNPDGRNLHFGVREHGMAGIVNGIALHGGFRIACSTFMVFSDYMRHSIRMSALMNLPVIYLFTHDSIGVGEDGKTHQPVEFNAMYRAMPNLNFVRPADREETKFGYKLALLSNNPTILSLTRQNTENTSKFTGKNAERGAYFVLEENDENDVIIYTSGSELGLALTVAKTLKLKGLKVQVASVPCVSVFESQTKSYKQKMMCGDAVVRVSIEASNDNVWYKFIGMDGLYFGVNDFGFTAKGEEVYAHFGLTHDNIVKTILKQFK